MVVGFAKDGRQRKVIGIDASATPKQTKAQVIDIARNTAKLVELGQEISDDEVVLLDEYAYPLSDRQERHAALVAETDERAGNVLDVQGWAPSIGSSRSGAGQ